MKFFSKNSLKKLCSTVALVMFFATVGAPAASAFEYGAQQNYILGEGQTLNDDLYVGAGTIDLSGVVSGDVFLAGESVDFSGTTTEDVAAAASVIDFNGRTLGDVRLAGERVTFSGVATSSVLVFGDVIEFTGDARVGGETFIYGVDVTLDGRYGDDVEVRGGQASVNGIINGNLESRARSLTIGPDAVVTGDVHYVGDAPNVNETATVTGEVVSVGTSTSTTSDESFVSGAVVVGFLMIAFGAFVFGLLFKRVGREGTMLMFSHDAWRYLLLGFFVLLSLPFLSALLIATVIGLPFAVLLFLLYGAWLILAWFFAPIFIGAMLWKWLQKNDAFEITWQSVLLGVFAFTGLIFVPIIGWGLQFFFVILSAGVLLSLVFRSSDTLR